MRDLTIQINEVYHSWLHDKDINVLYPNAAREILTALFAEPDFKQTYLRELNEVAQSKTREMIWHFAARNAKLFQKRYPKLLRLFNDWQLYLAGHKRKYREGWDTMVTRPDYGYGVFINQSLKQMQEREVNPKLQKYFQSCTTT